MAATDTAVRLAVEKAAAIGVGHLIIPMREWILSRETLEREAAALEGGKLSLGGSTIIPVACGIWVLLGGSVGAVFYFVGLVKRLARQVRCQHHHDRLAFNRLLQWSFGGSSIKTPPEPR